MGCGADANPFGPACDEAGFTGLALTATGIGKTTGLPAEIAGDTVPDCPVIEMPPDPRPPAAPAANDPDPPDITPDDDKDAPLSPPAATRGVPMVFPGSRIAVAPAARAFMAQ